MASRQVSFASTVPSPVMVVPVRHTEGPERFTSWLQIWGEAPVECRAMVVRRRPGSGSEASRVAPFRSRERPRVPLTWTGLEGPWSHSMDTASEVVLVERLREGDASALEVLMERYASRIFRIA